MKTSLPRIGIAAMLLGIGLWLLNQEPETHELGDGLASSGEAETLQEAKEGLANGGTVGERAVGLAVEDGRAEEIGQIESDWVVRYGAGKVVEERSFRIGPGRYRRQLLIETGLERMPWVVWEDKFFENAGGRLELVGSFASMGNVVLVEAKPGVVEAGELEAFAEENGLYVERRSRVSDYVCLGFNSPRLGRIEALIAAYTVRFPEALAEFDTISFPSVTPNDWDASRMWGLDMISARDAWGFEKGDAGTEVVIAVIDTGMQRLHPDLLGNLFANPGDGSANLLDDDGNGLVDDTSGWDFYDDDSDPQDDDGHGTHVAGIVGAVGNNDTGAVGVSWGVKLLPLKVGEGDGLRTSSINDALAYVTKLKRAGINIVATNNSYGSGGANQSTRSEIATHESEGILFVAAAGNDGMNLDASPDSQEYPAGYSLPNIISVGNSNQEDTLNNSSNYGSVSVDLSAPGSEIYSTYPTNGYAFLTGTSMASPMVAGAVGLLAQAEPGLTAAQLKARLMETGDLVSSQSRKTVSGRRLNLLAALKPELGGHFVEVSNVKDALILVDSVGSDVVFRTATHVNANVSGTIFYGPEVGDLVAEGNGVFRFVSRARGQAKVRFSANLGGVTRSVQKTIVVGDVNAVQNGLLHHFAFDGSGSVVTDLAGSSDGTIAKASRVDSEYGSSVDFGDVTETMVFNGEFSDLVTIAAFVRSDQMSVSPHPRIVNMPFYYLYFSSGDEPEVPDGNRQTLKFYSNYTNFGVWNTPPRSVKDNQWYYVVGTYNSTNLLNTPGLHINGEQQPVWMQQEPTGTMVKTGGVSYLGNNDVGDRAFDGLMADIRIYNRELNPVEISQLGASLMQDRWDGVRIVGPSLVSRGEFSTFRLEDSKADTERLRPQWFLDPETPGHLVSTIIFSANVRFEEVGVYPITVQVSDGTATYVFTQEVEVSDESVVAGHYEGTTAGGGLVWLEVEETLDTGYLTIYDRASGFYRIRESVTIEASGAFSTLEESQGKVFGSALTELTGTVPGYGLSFSGELQAVPSTVSSFEGDYRGGGLGQPGDSVRLRVLSDGRAFLLRAGPFADLALGEVSSEGRILASGAFGAAVDLVLDAESESVRGFWGEQSVYLNYDGVESDGRLMGGLVGGYPGGSGVSGLYSEFLEVGKEPSARLQAGEFANLSSERGVAGPFVLLDESGRTLRLVRSVVGDLANEVAAALESEAFVLDGREISGIRLQTPLSEGGSGLVAFSVRGSEPVEVLVRGLGPSFVAGGVEDPALSFYRLEGGEAMAFSPNDDWREGALFSVGSESAQGAFHDLADGFGALNLSLLEDAAKDAALRVWLEPGDYLVVARLASGVGGVSLLEVLELR